MKGSAASARFARWDRSTCRPTPVGCGPGQVLPRCLFCLKEDFLASIEISCRTKDLGNDRLVGDPAHQFTHISIRLVERSAGGRFQEIPDEITHQYNLVGVRIEHL